MTSQSGSFPELRKATNIGFLVVEPLQTGLLFGADPVIDVSGALLMAAVAAAAANCRVYSINNHKQDWITNVPRRTAMEQDVH